MPDWIEDASGYRGLADRILTPSSAGEVAQFLRDASASKSPVTIAGARTGVTGGCCPESGLLLSLDRFRRLDIGQGVATCGAGVPLADIHAAAQKSGQFYPPDPTEWTASLGGTIATNASGSRSFLYGSTREWLRSLTVAFMDGSIRTLTRGHLFDLPFDALPPPQTTKHTAGYYLRDGMSWVDLLCGAEGTLAVVLEAELELLPLPEKLLTGVVFFPGEAAALDAVDAWRTVPRLRMLEYFDAASLALLRRKYSDIPASARAALLIEQDLDYLPGDPIDAWLARLESASALDDSWFGETAQDRERFRAFRHALPELVNDIVRRNGFQKLGSDFAVPIAQSAGMMRFYRDAVTRCFPGASVIFGHIGDAHVHVNLLPETEAQNALGKELMLEFARHAVSLGGTVSAEHGLGKRKRHLLEIEYTPGQIEAMKAVKRQLDPHWLLGQGTLFAPPAATT